MTSHTFRATALAALVATLLPLPTFAATPTRAQEQKRLNQAIDSLSEQFPIKLDAMIDATIQERALRAPAKSITQTGSMQFHVTDRLLKKVGTTQDSEGSFIVNALDLSSETMPLKLDGPVSLEWKTVGGTAYFRVAQIPQSLIDMLKTQGMDLSQVVGPWVSVASSDLGDNIPSSITSELPSSVPIALPEQALNSLKAKQHFVVTKIESRTTTTNGHTIARLRVVPNATDITNAQNAELKTAYKIKTRTERTAAIKEINTRYRDMRKLLTKAQFAVNFDETNATIQRVEIGGTETQPTQTCTLNEKTWKNVCKTTGTKYITVAAGLNFFADSGAAVIAPASSQPLKTVLENFFKGLETPTDASSTSL